MSKIRHYQYMVLTDLLGFTVGVIGTLSVHPAGRIAGWAVAVIFTVLSFVDCAKLVKLQAKERDK